MLSKKQTLLVRCETIERRIRKSIKQQEINRLLEQREKRIAQVKIDTQPPKC